ncbi:hypothetical protein FRC04_003905 [Tulasnella sp. 424]|nr:hypothetical protein FRC04_003905 [Tulasnella sp. 424]KAG8964662.1 hypothetical protein FRC05_003621 [Tulasnella sp. 425]
MFTRAKKEFRELTVGITARKASTQPKAKDTKREDRFRPPPFKKQTSPLNDVLPPEILIEIFRAAILNVWKPAYRTMADLSLVCRSWRVAGRGLELYKASVTTSKQMDALLGHINTTLLFQERNRAAIQVLTVEASYLKDFYRLPELLKLCRTSLRVLYLRRYSKPNVSEEPIVKLL